MCKLTNTSLTDKGKQLLSSSRRLIYIRQHLWNNPVNLLRWPQLWETHEYSCNVRKSPEIGAISDQTHTGEWRACAISRENHPHMSMNTLDKTCSGRLMMYVEKEKKKKKKEQVVG